MNRTAFLIVAACLPAAGCGESRDPREKPVFPVTGRVTVSGQPAYEAKVILTPTVPFGDNFTPLPQATVQADGTFDMVTYLGTRGAPAGEYAVTIVWRPGDKPLSRDRGPDRLGGKYADPKKTPLKVTVTEGMNALPPFELTPDAKKAAALAAADKAKRKRT